MNLGSMERGGRRQISQSFSIAVMMREEHKDMLGNEREFKFRNLFANTAKPETFYRL